MKVLNDKSLPKILGRLGKENSYKRRCNIAFVQHKFGVTSVLVRFLYAMYESQAKTCVFVQGSLASRERCPVCIRIPELSVRVSTAVCCTAKCGVTSHNTSICLLGTFQASNKGDQYTTKLFRSSSIIFS